MAALEAPQLETVLAPRKAQRACAGRTHGAHLGEEVGNRRDAAAGRATRLPTGQPPEAAALFIGGLFSKSKIRPGPDGSLLNLGEMTGGIWVH